MRRLIREWDRKHYNLGKDTYRGRLAAALVARDDFEATIQPIPGSFWPWTQRRLEREHQALLDELAVLESEVVRCETEWNEHIISLKEERDSATPF